MQYVVNKTEQSTEKKFQSERIKRTRKRNAVETPSADVEIFVVADKETVAVHGNDTMEGYILTMMNMVRKASLILITNGYRQH